MSAASVETWADGRDGIAREFTTGRCDRCESLVMIAPTPAAVESARARLDAMKAAVREVAGDA